MSSDYANMSVSASNHVYVRYTAAHALVVRAVWAQNLCLQAGLIATGIMLQAHALAGALLS